jgi:hypothetical protein
MAKVLRIRLEKLQILWPVIAIIAIHMVDDFVALQKPTKFLLHHQAVLRHVAPRPFSATLARVRMLWAVNQPVSVAVLVATALPLWVLRAATRASALRLQAKLFHSPPDLFIGQTKDRRRLVLLHFLNFNQIPQPICEFLGNVHLVLLSS